MGWRASASTAELAGIKTSDISLILHTHGHVDHAGSTAALKQILGIPAAVHLGDETLMRTGRMNPLRPLRLEAHLIKPVVDKPFPPVAPDLFVDESTDLGELGLQGRILHTPGHTAGSISVLFPDGRAIVGDVMMGGYMGGNLFGSRPNYHYFADDLETVRQSIKQLLDLRVSEFYVGHGGPLAADSVHRAFRQ